MFYRHDGERAFVLHAVHSFALPPMRVKQDAVPGVAALVAGMPLLAGGLLW
jgi:hypothetical protein